MAGEQDAPALRGRRWGVVRVVLDSFHECIYIYIYVLEVLQLGRNSVLLNPGINLFVDLQLKVFVPPPGHDRGHKSVHVVEHIVQHGKPEACNRNSHENRDQQRAIELDIGGVAGGVKSCSLLGSGSRGRSDARVGVGRV